MDAWDENSNRPIDIFNVALRPNIAGDDDVVQMNKRTAMPCELDMSSRLPPSGMNIEGCSMTGFSLKSDLWNAAVQAANIKADEHYLQPNNIAAYSLEDNHLVFNGDRLESALREASKWMVESQPKLSFESDESNKENNSTQKSTQQQQPQQQQSEHLMQLPCLHKDILEINKGCELDFPSCHNILWDRKQVDAIFELNCDCLVPVLNYDKNTLKLLYHDLTTNTEDCSFQLIGEPITLPHNRCLANDVFFNNFEIDMNSYHNSNDNPTKFTTIHSSIYHQKPTPEELSQHDYILNSGGYADYFVLNSKTVSNELTFDKQSYNNMIDKLILNLKVDGPYSPLKLIQMFSICKTLPRNRLIMMNELLLPNIQLSFKPIKTLIILNTPLSTFLEKKQENEDYGLSIDSPESYDNVTFHGFLTLNSTRKAVPLLENDVMAYNMPIVGIWLKIKGNREEISKSNILFTYCVRYLHNHYIQTKVGPSKTEPNSFLILIYPTSRDDAPYFLECSLKPIHQLSECFKQYFNHFEIDISPDLPPQLHNEIRINFNASDAKRKALLDTCLQDLPRSQLLYVEDKQVVPIPYQNESNNSFQGNEFPIKGKEIDIACDNHELSTSNQDEHVTYFRENHKFELDSHSIVENDNFIENLLLSKPPILKTNLEQNQSNFQFKEQNNSDLELSMKPKYEAVLSEQQNQLKMMQQQIELLQTKLESQKIDTRKIPPALPPRPKRFVKPTPSKAAVNTSPIDVSQAVPPIPQMRPKHIPPTPQTMADKSLPIIEAATMETMETPSIEQVATKLEPKTNQNSSESESSSHQAGSESEVLNDDLNEDSFDDISMQILSLNRVELIDGYQSTETDEEETCSELDISSIVVPTININSTSPLVEDEDDDDVDEDQTYMNRMEMKYLHQSNSRKNYDNANNILDRVKRDPPLLP